MAKDNILFSVISDIDGDTQPTLEEARRLAAIYVDMGCEWCFIERLEEGHDPELIEVIV